MRLAIIFLGFVLTITYASPALGGPDFASKLRRVDQREQRHYASLDRRLRATDALLLNSSVRTSVQQTVMTQSASGRGFAGSAGCPFDQRLTGGGVDWGTNPEYTDWHAVSSGPNASGSSWHAALSIGNGPGPSTFPIVYAVCAKT